MLSNFEPKIREKCKQHFRLGPFSGCFYRKKVGRCGSGVDTTNHFQLDCQFFYTQRESLLAVVNPLVTKINPNFLGPNPLS